MATKNVDIVFLMDASESMAPCFRQVCDNINTLLEQPQLKSFNIHLGLLAHCMPNYNTYRFQGLTMANPIDLIYQPHMQNRVRDELFTTDVSKFRSKLGSITPQGDEDTLCALDTACDFPFRPLQITQRVIILLTDEKFEDGLNGDSSCRKVSAIIEKLQNRNITIWGALPESQAAMELSTADRSDFEFLQNAHDGLRNFDFQNFFLQLGKTISTRVTQMTAELPYRKGLFGQATWGRTDDTTVIHDLGYRQ